jgi:hypothetical protein
MAKKEDSLVAVPEIAKEDRPVEFEVNKSFGYTIRHRHYLVKKGTLLKVGKDDELIERLARAGADLTQK